MRIAVVAHSYPPARLGGAEIYSEAYANALAALGHEVFVYAAEKNVAQADGSVRAERRGGVAITWITNNLYYSHFEETYRRPSTVPQYLQFLAEARPGIVHFQHLMDVGAALPRETKKKSPAIAVAMTLHDYWFTCPRFGQRYHPDGFICEDIKIDVCARCVESMEWRQPRGFAIGGAALSKLKRATGIDITKPAKNALARIRRSRPSISAATEAADPGTSAAMTSRRPYFEREVYPFVDLFFSPTRALAVELLRHGLPARKTSVQRLGIEPLAPGPPPRPRETGRPIIVAFHGQFTRPKAPDLLLNAWISLSRSTRGGATLILRGAPRDPAFYKEIETLAAAAGAALEAPFSRDSAAEKLAATDLLVVPSVWWENAPLSILEAFSMRVPVLATNHGGMAELVEEGVGGFRFRAGDAADLAAMITKLVQHPALLREAAARAPRVRSIAEDAAELPGRILEAANAKTNENPVS
ncbi:MAG: glycosyltransferase [Planctomycetes bacterium]|nr:glycosyltransferase [Planctomycetota bacterium]